MIVKRNIGERLEAADLLCNVLDFCARLIECARVYLFPYCSFRFRLFASVVGPRICRLLACHIQWQLAVLPSKK